ncbi:TetR/AcrR family transcriptional regulator [Shewanella sedimentimangrovi]|uniref:TetR/AcrR family transcriptional regulator n=1 Tax=Shewanella sedimentimangrovi TaxID=2814293 RepID=A0ABX7R3D2_9GAMM|nr:TetR/AcrR family transcriptional regulator [Shewanella sedimentimangrovi]QSX37807.1 TetR/AcrR family transcriptional regulator [Shewanella sedimentimangrovi]
MSGKREALIDSALALFYSKGVNSIGINEILATAGIAKKTLYSHFQGKEDLLLAVLARRDAIYLQWLDDKLSQCVSNKELVRRLFAALEHWFLGEDSELGDFRGCFFINTAAEFSDPNSAVSLYCKAHKQRVRELIARNMPEENGALLDLICLLKEGAIVSAYVNQDPAAAGRCADIIVGTIA